MGHGTDLLAQRKPIWATQQASVRLHRLAAVCDGDAGKEHDAALPTAQRLRGSQGDPAGQMDQAAGTRQGCHVL